MARPEASEYTSSYAAYIDLVPEEDIVAVLETQGRTLSEFLRSIPADRAGHRYAAGKWSVREIIGHIADGERVFSYRLLAFARDDAQDLPGFDQELWVPKARHDDAPMGELIAELEAIRTATIHLVRHLPAEAWDRSGKANGNRITVRALAFGIAGHARHHEKILRERYLS